MTDDVGFELRPMVASDESFVFRAWLEGFWPSFCGNIVLPKSEYCVRWHRVIEALLVRSTTVVAVAAGSPGTPGTLLGFSCSTPTGDPVLHWCYVKQAFRGLGIARALVGSAKRCSHWSEHIPRDWSYYPQALKGLAP